MKTNRFESGSGCYKCRRCGKATRETGCGESDCELCAKCYQEAGLENEHSDYGHSEYNHDCPTCRSNKAKAGANVS